VEDFAVAYTPSASVLKFRLDKNRYQRETVLALGNPNLKNPAFRLVHAENEVNGIKGIFPKVDVYAGDAATEAVVKLQGVGYDVLHFACHGELNLDDPMLTHCNSHRAQKTTATFMPAKYSTATLRPRSWY
jgi:CHAT domain-containing protein